MPTFNTVVDSKTGAMGGVLKDLKGLWAETLVNQNPAQQTINRFGRKVGFY